MRKKVLSLAVLAILCASTAGCCSVDAEYLASFRDAVKEEHLRYVLADTSLDVQQKDRRARTWRVFEGYLKAAGGSK